jgi:hypothetical protein
VVWDVQGLVGVGVLEVEVVEALCGQGLVLELRSRVGETAAAVPECRGEKHARVGVERRRHRSWTLPVVSTVINFH